MQSLLKLSRGIDAFTRWTGKRLAWLILVAVIVSAVNAIVRKAFDTSSNSSLPKTVRNIIDIVGHVFFLLPLCVVMIITGGPFFMRSYEIGEQSGNAGGLPQWPTKSLIIIAFAFLLVQGVSELIKRIAVMQGLIPDPHAAQVNTIEAEVEQLVEAIEKR